MVPQRRKERGGRIWLTACQWAVFSTWAKYNFPLVELKRIKMPCSRNLLMRGWSPGDASRWTGYCQLLAFFNSINRGVVVTTHSGSPPSHILGSTNKTSSKELGSRISSITRSCGVTLVTLFPPRMSLAPSLFIIPLPTRGQGHSSITRKQWEKL